MGLQDVLMTSATSGPGLRKSRNLGSAKRRKSSKDSSSNSLLEDDLKKLRVKDDSIDDTNNNNNSNNNVTSSNVVGDAEAMEDIYNDDGDEGKDEDESLACDTDECETDEGRLSRALQKWMQDYVLTPIPQMYPSSRQPVFSARLGGRSAIRRSDSSESTDTQISLFSCSSYGSRVVRRRKRIRRRRKKTADTTRQDATSSAGTSKPGSAATTATAAGGGSRWEELAKQRKSELNRFMKSRTHALSQVSTVTVSQRRL